MFEKKRSKLYSVEYDPNKQKAVLKCSICNGEQVAGFKDKATGHFTEVAYIKDENYYTEEETFLPDGIEIGPARFAIDRRNKWMVEQADYVIIHVMHSWGGAAKFKELAEKKGKTVINIER